MKKMIGNSLITVMVTISLAACSSNSNPGGGKSADPTSVTKHDPVKLVIQNAYNSDDQARFMQDYGDLITKKFPYISFDYSLSADEKNRVTAGGDIDIVMTSVGLTQPNLLDYNLQTDISGLISKNKYDLSRLEPTTVEMQHNFASGGIYGLPVNTVTLALFYNKDIFDKFGVSYPKDDMTWDDIYNIAKKVSRSDGGVNYRGFDFSMIHYGRMNQLSLPYLDPKTNQPTFMNDGWQEVIQNFARFNQIPGNESKTFSGLATATNEFVKTKSLAMVFIGSNTIMETQNLDAFKQVNWDVVSGPYFKEKMGVSTQSYPVFFYIAANSKHKDDDFDVISYLTSEEFQLQQSKKGVVSILKDDKNVIDAFGQDADNLKGKNIKALLPKKYADPAPYNQYSSAAEPALLNAAKSVYLNTSDLNTALRTAVDEANKAVQTKMAK